MIYMLGCTLFLFVITESSPCDKGTLTTVSCARHILFSILIQLYIRRLDLVLFYEPVSTRCEPHTVRCLSWLFVSTACTACRKKNFSFVGLWGKFFLELGWCSSKFWMLALKCNFYFEFCCCMITVLGQIMNHISHGPLLCSYKLWAICFCSQGPKTEFGTVLNFKL